MLPISTTCIVGVRYDVIYKFLNGRWKIGTHTLDGTDELVVGFQLVHWTWPQRCYQSSCNSDLRSVIEPLLRLRSTHPHGSLLIMSASINDRALCASDLFQDKLVLINSVASSWSYCYHGCLGPISHWTFKWMTDTRLIKKNAMPKQQ